MKKILFVCHGNICRSPMAEFILKSLSDKYIIESRSTSLEQIGNDLYPPAKDVLTKHNIPFDRHYAKQITLDDYNNFDLIICFDNNNLNNLSRMLNDMSKVRKLTIDEIDDPWYTREFDRCFNEIYNGCVNLIKELD